MKKVKRWAYRKGSYIWVGTKAPKKGADGKPILETVGTSIADFQWKLIFGSLPPDGKVTPIESGMGKQERKKKAKKKRKAKKKKATAKGRKAAKKAWKTRRRKKAS